VNNELEGMWKEIVVELFHLVPEDNPETIGYEADIRSTGP
jgi:hypothetical protein